MKCLTTLSIFINARTRGTGRLSVAILARALGPLCRILFSQLYQDADDPLPIKNEICFDA